MKLLLHTKGYKLQKDSLQTKNQSVCTVTVVALCAINACFEAVLNFNFREFYDILRQGAALIIICATETIHVSGLNLHSPTIPP